MKRKDFRMRQIQDVNEKSPDVLMVIAMMMMMRKLVL